MTFRPTRLFGILSAIVVACVLFGVGSAVLRGAVVEQDITEPKIVWLNIEPTFIDTSDAPQTITLTVRITDDLVGFNILQLHMRTENASSQQKEFYFRAANRISGDALDGVYRDTILLPRYSAYGVWSAYLLCAFDKIENYKCYIADIEGKLGFSIWFHNGPLPSVFLHSVFMPSVQR